MRKQLFFLVTILTVCNSLLQIRDNPELCADVNLLKTLHPPGPKTALASLPGSGNTWVRHLLQLVTGIFTGAQYKGEENAKSFPGGFLTNGSALVIKDHFLDPNTIQEYDKVVLLIRHPIHQLIAYADWISRDTHHDTHLPLKYYQLVLDGLVSRHIYAWREWHENILKHFTAPNICVLNYDRLKQNVMEELDKCARFLGFDVDFPSLQNCVAHHQKGSHRRKPRSIGETEMILSFVSRKNRRNSQKVYDEIVQILAKNSYQSDKCFELSSYHFEENKLIYWL